MTTKKKSSAAKSRRRLGRGLGSLITAPVQVEIPPLDDGREPGSVETEKGSSGGGEIRVVDSVGGVQMLDIRSISPNPKQPRQQFDDVALAALAESIKTAGVMQPIIVRPGSGSEAPGVNEDGEGVQGNMRSGEVVEIIAGERRWRAAKLAGLTHIPAIIRQVDDQTAAQLSLIENLQREDLNPIERAEAFQQLIATFHLTHQDIANDVSLDRSSITNHLRLLTLDDDTQQAIRMGKLTLGHGKELLAITNNKQRSHLARQSIEQGWSVRDLARRVKRLTSTPTGKIKQATSSPHLQDLQQKLSEHLGTRVTIHPGRSKGAGKLHIEFYSLDQFEGLMQRMGFEHE